MGIPLLMAFQNGGKSAEKDHSGKPAQLSNRADSISTGTKKPIKQVKPNKTKIHHVKKVESTIPKTFN